VHGGVVQGLAQALFEEAVYDEDGNLKTSTLAEYLTPAASDVPALTLGHTVTPSPTNQLGVKGIGEAGTIGAAPAVINAIVDALSGLGVTDVPMPASPLNVWRAIHGTAATPSDTASTDVGAHDGVTARTTTAEQGAPS
jgi:carbon-monoxide dehydrogenase large subunit